MTTHDPPPSTFVRDGIIAAALAVAAVAAYAGTCGYALVGYDSYPLILASRIQSGGDFFGTFTEIMMDGRYPAGDFFRPTQNLFLALDDAIWGITPFGYHATTLSFFALSNVLLYLVSRRLLGPRAWLGPLLGTVFFMLHPSVMSILPAMPRRVELLALVFVLAALLALPIRDESFTWRRHILVALFAWLAAGSKEIGVIVVGLVFLHQFFFREWDERPTADHPPESSSESCGGSQVAPVGHSTPGIGLFGRTLRAALATLPSLAAVGLYLLNRYLVIGGLGGHPELHEGGLWGKLVSFSPQWATSVFHPWPFAGDAYSIRLTAITGFVFTLALAGECTMQFIQLRYLTLMSRKARNENTKMAAIPAYRADIRALLGLVVIGLAWLLVNMVFIGLAGMYNERYVMFSVVGVSFLISAIIESTRTTLRAMSVFRGCMIRPAPVHASEASSSRRANKETAGRFIPLSIILVWLIPAALWKSPLWTDYPEWRTASAMQSDYLASLEKKNAAATAGARITDRDMPWIPDTSSPDRPRLDNVVMLADYSLQAWCELRFPEKNIRVYRGSRKDIPPPAADEIQLLVWYRQPPRR